MMVGERKGAGEAHDFLWIINQQNELTQPGDFLKTYDIILQHILVDEMMRCNPDDRIGLEMNLRVD